MAERRERPYARFNFLVSWDGLDEGTVEAGFMEVSGLAFRVDVVEYRAGNSPENVPLKMAGLTRVSDVTLKRGVIGSLDLFAWLRAVSVGEPDQRRSVTIKLLSENRQAVAQAWQLVNAQPIAYVGPTLNAQAQGELAIESLTLAAERIELA